MEERDGGHPARRNRRRHPEAVLHRVPERARYQGGARHAQAHRHAHAGRRAASRLCAASRAGYGEADGRAQRRRLVHEAPPARNHPDVCQSRGEVRHCRLCSHAQARQLDDQGGRNRGFGSPYDAGRRFAPALRVETGHADKQQARQSRVIGAPPAERVREAARAARSCHR